MNKLLCEGVKICWRLVALSIGMGIVTHVGSRVVERMLLEPEHEILIEKRDDE